MVLVEKLSSVNSDVWPVSHDDNRDNTHLFIWSNVDVGKQEVLMRFFVKDQIIRYPGLEVVAFVTLSQHYSIRSVSAGI